MLGYDFPEMTLFHLLFQAYSRCTLITSFPLGSITFAAAHLCLPAGDCGDVVPTSPAIPKVLYVLSRTSNTKPGALKELALAQTVAKVHQFRDFVIPLKIDDISYADININLHQLNAVSFEKGWREGFQQLLLKIELDGVQKDARFTPDDVISIIEITRDRGHRVRHWTHHAMEGVGRQPRRQIKR